MDDESQTFVNTHPVRQFPSPGRLERHLPSEFEREKLGQRILHAVFIFIQEYYSSVAVFYFSYFGSAEHLNKVFESYYGKVKSTKSSVINQLKQYNILRFINFARISKT